jgi:hypothetical protein
MGTLTMGGRADVKRWAMAGHRSIGHGGAQG